MHAINLIKIGDIVSLDFNSVVLSIVEKEQGKLTARVINGGKIGQNKAVSLDRTVKLKAITDKDKNAIKRALALNISHFALSFANSGEDVREFRKLIGNDSFLISKIESKKGLSNLEDIISESDAILLDRGDMSREVAIEFIPPIQKQVIQLAKKAKKLVFVATNLLESMIEAPEPTRAEVNDIFNTLNDGADGLVLAAETAIGKYPVQSTEMVHRVIESHANAKKDADKFYFNPSTLIIEPHGGDLVNQIIANDSAQNIHSFKHLIVDDNDLMDAQQIALGTYSPIRGFMNEATLNTVLSNYLLPNDIVWPMPLILQIGAKDNVPELGERIVLSSHQGQSVAFLDVSEIYSINLPDVAKSFFGTSDKSHPGVNRLIKKGNIVLAGRVTLIEKLANPLSSYDYSPEQIRHIFMKKGWSKIVGFHTRNPAHRVHEYIQLEALKLTNSDGVLINPVIGEKKEGDFLPEIVIGSYEVLLKNNIYPKNSALLSGFSTYSRFAGPREALFTAICRKNMGCSDFIIGRDHTGVKDYYSSDDLHALFEKVGDIGIRPIFFGKIGYDSEIGDYAAKTESTKTSNISGSEIRQMIRDNMPIPETHMRLEVQEFLQEKIKKDIKVFD